VLKLFEIAQPHFAFLGRKDAQQAHILQRMLQDLNSDVELVLCAIAREPDGLALSSRNAYLNPEERRAAAVLHRALEAVKSEVLGGARDALSLENAARRMLAEETLARVDYVEVARADTFEPVARIGAQPAYVLLAVFVGKTRLIDNLLIAPAPDSGDLIISL
jgi:pantoate--beta-alanine ligase